MLRIPENLRRTLNKNAKVCASHSTGCELRFRLKSPSFTIHIQACHVGGLPHGGGLAQILFGDFSYTYFPIVEGENHITCTAPDHHNLRDVSNHPCFHPDLVRILLPTHASISGIQLKGDFTSPQSGDLPSRRALHYGSSITQGTGATSSRESWAGICALHLNADLINLGFGGGCHCEPEMTDYLCARNDFDFAVLELGVNMINLDHELAEKNLQNFIRKFSAAHSDKPIFFISPFPCHDDIIHQSQGRAQEFRELIASEVTSLHTPNAHFIDGKQALNPQTGLTVDLTHPSPAGMIQIGTYISSEIKKHLL
ncbi:SGNH/GDSL hydrolase family protein [Kiritimatiellota bacterium B12222]|nr:SGNH/GDSL hydrolase family protein [Kiritimatiellota bacterium B12222]